MAAEPLEAREADLYLLGLVTELGRHARSAAAFGAAILLGGLALVWFGTADRYRATATFLPAKIRGDFSESVSGSPTSSTPPLVRLVGRRVLPIYEIVTGRATKRAVIERLGLVKVFGVGDVEQAEGALSRIASIGIRDSGAFQVSVEASSPELSLRICEAFVAHIAERSQQFLEEDSRPVMEFVRARSGDTKNEEIEPRLVSAELSVLQQRQPMQILDPPVLPRYPTTRKKLLSVVVAFLAAGGALGLAVLQTALDRYRTLRALSASRG